MRDGGPAGATTTGSTVQPAAAGTVIIGIGSPPCGKSQTDSLRPGGGINVTVRLDVTSRTYRGRCRASFTMNS